MSESRIQGELGPGDRAVLRALEEVVAGNAPPAATDLDPAAQAEFRASVELLGLLPYALPAAAPPAAARERLLARLGERPVAAAEREGASVVPIAGWQKAPAGAPAAARPPGAGSWGWGLAAMLALCLLGLAYLAGKVSQQNATIARLERQLDALPPADFDTVQDDLQEMERRFHMVTNIARKAYRMQNVHQTGAMPGPEGIVYVCGYHQRWYLTIQGLEPPPPGKTYYLWFVTDQGMVNGGVVDVVPGQATEMDAQSMPQGTHGFAVSLEEAEAQGEPAGVMVLLAEDAISL